MANRQIAHRYGLLPESRLLSTDPLGRMKRAYRHLFRTSGANHLQGAALSFPDSGLSQAVTVRWTFSVLVNATRPDFRIAWNFASPAYTKSNRRKTDSPTNPAPAGIGKSRANMSQ